MRNALKGVVQEPVTRTAHACTPLPHLADLQAAVLRLLRASTDSSVSMGGLLRDAEAQHLKSCDEDLGGCNTPNPVNHFLDRAPRVFTLQLAWESHSEQPADIAGTLAAVDEEVGSYAVVAW